MEAGAIPHPSLGRNLQSDSPPPNLIHSLHENKSSVLSLAANEEYIFSGSQNKDISVWDKKTFQLKTILRGHTGSVLALEYAPKEKWLFSSSGDSTVRVWSAETLQQLYIIYPYMGEGAGDLFSLVWVSSLQTIFIGCQNTSLQWYNFNDFAATRLSISGSPPDSISKIASAAGASATPPASVASGTATTGTAGTVTPSSSRQAHKFFDSYPQYERKPADIFANNQAPGRASPDSLRSVSTFTGDHLDVPPTNVIDSAHYGYIYTMAVLVRGEKDILLATGSGDETVKLWKVGDDIAEPELVHEFECNHGAVLALAARGDTIYAGCQEGYVRVFDLETKTLVRTIIVHEGVDIISMSMLKSDLYTCSADGSVKRWSASFDCTASWKAHSGIVLSSIITKRNGLNDSNYRLITGGNDNYINVWEVLPTSPRKRLTDDDYEQDTHNSCIGSGTFFDTMVYALTKFVSIPSVSSNTVHREDCRQSAIWLRKCLGQLGAHTSLLANEGYNHIVLGTFTGSAGDKPRPRILFYGHYDVIPAPAEGWHSDPFSLTGRNGYLYGRGVTDNKGPIIAAACAAADLLSQRALGVDLVFLIEGEEECGSQGFKQTIQKHKAAIGHIDAILVSNSTWIADDKPCITYGLRGVVHCGVTVKNDGPDVHSGIEGGAIGEPMIDMVRLLSTLIDSTRVVQIPGFYDKVRLQTKEEEELYSLLSQVTSKPASLLSSRWREPSLTIHNVEISGPRNSTVIPGRVDAQISLRVVPDQDLETIVQSLCDYLNQSFAGLQSSNSLEINVKHTADWWLGSLDDHWFKALEGAVQEEWGTEPLRIREGGSIPSVPYLEKEFGCHALHLPMGQSSDQAHLPDERISLVNLEKGKAVIERFLRSVATK
ncbi:hypothetical protein D9619_006998 [Psilocybe cf. subviscida]|uniref:Peptidase M20 dimerisation domain-containing protein n=1 Tax=Psilocybe cf. subviscida TaxID=2480587 RepID=A0A8H5EWW0_9AGAR|nr:hypothetical protein D9619_006998 [Psilocybe cf. subviscida]